jgi:hypothetical protein
LGTKKSVRGSGNRGLARPSILRLTLMSRHWFSRAGGTSMLRSIALLVLTLAGEASAHAEFVPGRVYVSYLPSEFFPAPRIFEFDPATGASRQFFVIDAPPNEPHHSLSGLVFTPDGTGLRSANGFFHRILEIDGDANARVVLDGDDSLSFPGRGMAYDAAGNFLVMNTGTRQILRFPAGGGPEHVFADVPASGPLAAGLAGILYSGDFGGTDIRRYTSQGEGSLFDRLPAGNQILSLVTAPSGDLFVRTRSAVYRYAGGDPSARTLLAEVTAFPSGDMALSADGTRLFVDRLFDMLSVDVYTGAVSNLGMLPFVDGMYPGAGMAVYIPEPASIFLIAVAGAIFGARRGRGP